MPSPSDPREALLAKIRSHDALVGIIGLGYVGLPLALAFVEKGFTRPRLRRRPGEGRRARRAARATSSTSTTARLAAAVAQRAGSQATTDFARLGEPDAILICVPTPLTPQREPDMSYVVELGAADRSDAARRASSSSSSRRPTRAPPTSCVRGILEETGPASCGAATSSSPSPPSARTPATSDFSTTNTPKVVGGVDAGLRRPRRRPSTTRSSRGRCASPRRAPPRPPSSPRTSSARSTSRSSTSSRSSTTAWASTSGRCSTRPRPSPSASCASTPVPGWGGHCIPLDPFYLSWKAREYGVSPKFIELAGEVNVRDARATSSRSSQRPSTSAGKAVKGSQVLVLGLAYKKDIDDPRESPAFEIIELLMTLRRRGQLPRPAHPGASADPQAPGQGRNCVGPADRRDARCP